MATQFSLPPAKYTNGKVTRGRIRNPSMAKGRACRKKENGSSLSTTAILQGFYFTIKMAQLESRTKISMSALLKKNISHLLSLELQAIANTPSFVLVSLYSHMTALTLKIQGSLLSASTSDTMDAPKPSPNTVCSCFMPCIDFS